MNGRKIEVEEPTHGSPNVKAQRQKEGSSQTVISPCMNTQMMPEGEGQPPPSTLWCDTDFDNLWFKIYHLPFSNECPRDYQALQPKSTHATGSMKDKLLIRALMLEDID
ncbi:unnamed protein product [Vicia faba]|uniref:Uncharacterized protein n=1 Tax=Vicia faba TaxID=3906 RepID=A0AAV0YIK2_VICFA|nr:unnamed protein product [Vicia faba]